MTRRNVTLGAALVACAALVVVAAVRGERDSAPPSRCADGLAAIGARCCGEGQHLDAGRCAGAPLHCAKGMRAAPEGCVPVDRDERVTIAGGHLRIGPGDWEAQGVVTPHEADIEPFAMSVHEVTEAGWARCVLRGFCREVALTGEPGRAVTAMTYYEAATFCRHEGGRLPTRDEFAFAMMGPAGRRYAWGDTGAVCRRAAWGLLNGPCASGGDGPDLVGAHPDGVSREGLHDLSGNVAEWVISPDDLWNDAYVVGGSWADAEAAALRGWNQRVVRRDARDHTVGFRCVYPMP